MALVLGVNSHFANVKGPVRTISIKGWIWAIHRLGAQFVNTSFDLLEILTGFESSNVHDKDVIILGM